MNKQLGAILAFISLCFVVLIIWQVYGGYNHSIATFRTMIELVLRDNRITNQVFLDGYKTRLGDLASYPDRIPLNSFGDCPPTEFESCLAGLVVVPKNSPIINTMLKVDCGQFNLVKSLDGEIKKQFIVGPTVYMPSQQVMAPVAYALNDDSGWLAACIGVDKIREFWRGLNLPAKTSMALVRASDFHLWIREPFKPELLGRDLSDGPLVTAMLAQEVDSEGIADITATKTDFVQRTVQWSPIGIGDLVLVVGYPKSYLFKSWIDSEASHLIILSILCIAFILLTVYTYIRISLQFKKVTDLAHDLNEAQRTASIGNWSILISTNEVQWSAELYKMSGLDPKLPPPSYNEHQKLFTQESWKQLITFLSQMKENGLPGELELRTVRKGGGKGWLWIKGEAIKDRNGELVTLRGIAQDITRQKDIENQLRSREKELETYRLQLEKLVEERTSELASLNQELRNNLAELKGDLETAEVRRRDLVRKMSEKALKTSDMVQLNAQLTRRLDENREEIDILHRQVQYFTKLLYQDQDTEI